MGVICLEGPGHSLGGALNPSLILSFEGLDAALVVAGLLDRLLCLHHLHQRSLVGGVGRVVLARHVHAVAEVQQVLGPLERIAQRPVGGVQQRGQGQLLFMARRARRRFVRVVRRL